MKLSCVGAYGCIYSSYMGLRCMVIVHIYPPSHVPVMHSVTVSILVSQGI